VPSVFAVISAAAASAELRLPETMDSHSAALSAEEESAEMAAEVLAAVSVVQLPAAQSHAPRHSSPMTADSAREMPHRFHFGVY